MNCCEKAKLVIEAFTNLMKNAIVNCEGKGDKIDFKNIRNKSGIKFSAEYYVKGILEEIQEKIFKNMISIKVMNGEIKKLMKKGCEVDSRVIESL